jgi:hypothetical protein
MARMRKRLKEPGRANEICDYQEIEAAGQQETKIDQRYRTVRYGTVWYKGTVRYGKVRYGTVRYGTVQ